MHLWACCAPWIETAISTVLSRSAESPPEALTFKFPFWYSHLDVVCMIFHLLLPRRFSRSNSPIHIPSRLRCNSWFLWDWVGWIHRCEIYNLGCLCVWWGVHNNFLPHLLVTLKVFLGYLLSTFVTLTHFWEVLRYLCHSQVILLCAIFVDLVTDELHFETRLQTNWTHLPLQLWCY